MIQLHTLKPAKGSVRKTKRIGRGQGSGKGGTSTRGHKGAKSRSGYKRKIGFEGGQLPLQRRIPRFGFKNIFKITYKPINLYTMQHLIEQSKVKSIDAAILKKHGFIGKHDKFKILGKGVLKTKIDVVAHAFSASALSTIEKLGGKATTL